LLLLAKLANVSHLAAVVALGNALVNQEAGALEALQVLLGVLRPTLSMGRDAWLSRELEGEEVLLTDFARRGDDGVYILDFLLLGNKVDLEIGFAECTLQLVGLDNRHIFIGEAHVEVDLAVCIESL
jgi:hypothetical protein